MDEHAERQQRFGDPSKEMLLLEYERSSEFCNHVDDLRNVITSFFLTVVGAAAFMIDKYGAGDLKGGPLGSAVFRVVALLAVVDVLGMLFIIVIGRLRRVQIERYEIMNSILDRLLDGEARKIVPFSNSTIAGSKYAGALSRRATGSYFWTLIIVIPAAVLAGVGAGMLTLKGTSDVRLILPTAIASAVAYLLVCDISYFRASRQ